MREFDVEDAHVRVFSLGNDAEIEIRYDTSGLAPASVPGIGLVTYVIARRDTIYGMTSSGVVLSVLVGFIDTSEVLSTTDTVLFDVGGQPLHAENQP